MRIRTAKQRAQRIDLYYFTRARGMRRWRLILSAALPLAAVVWISAAAMAGNRTAYSAGPVSSAHAFAELRCEVCHRAANAPAAGRASVASFRVHATDAACVTCHDAPAHAANMTPAAACADCHQEHRGRVQIAKMDDGFCVQCHGNLKTTHGAPVVAGKVGRFPDGHPEFAAAKPGAADPGRLRFNHAVHLKPNLRGPAGPGQLQCAACHAPELRPARAGAKGPAATGLMTPASFQTQCARCHPLFFDERIERAAPHAAPEAVRTFVRQALSAYIREHPDEIDRPDSEVRRVPLNFPRPPEPPARDADEWVARRAATDERILWNKTCAECHEPISAAAGGAPPVYAPSAVTRPWMPRAAFDHTPHAMVQCASCHAAETSSRTTDVLMPNAAICASCHAPSDAATRPAAGRAEGRCFECHRYHDWTKSHPVTPAFSLTDFK